MLLWCSISVSRISSPALTFVSPQLRATRLIAGGRAGREDDFGRAAGVDELADRFAGRFVVGAALRRQAVAAAVHVAVVVLVGLDHRLDHLPRPLRRGGVVEIDERAAVAERRCKDRKVAADRLDIERRRRQRLAGDDRRRQERLLRLPRLAVAAGARRAVRGLERNERQRLTSAAARRLGCRPRLWRSPESAGPSQSGRCSASARAPAASARRTARRSGNARISAGVLPEKAASRTAISPRTIWASLSATNSSVCGVPGPLLRHQPDRAWQPSTRFSSVLQMLVQRRQRAADLDQVRQSDRPDRRARRTRRDLVQWNGNGHEFVAADYRRPAEQVPW